MGYLNETIDRAVNGVGENTLNIITGGQYGVTRKAGSVANTPIRKKQEERAAQVAAQAAAMQDAARRQQIDILSQAKAAADTQADLAMRQAIQDKVAEQRAAATPGEVDVTLSATPDQPQSAIRAKRRKQFGFDSSGYSPGVSL